MRVCGNELTDEQRRVLDFVVATQRGTGAPPTLREIARHFGYRSVNNARQHLQLIERKGWIRRAHGRARRIEVLVGRSREDQAGGAEVPLVGTIAAGAPILAVENLDGAVVVDSGLFGGEGLFSLRVKGDSMRDAGILDGDIAVIREQPGVDSGQIAAVVVEGEATLKRVRRRAGKVVLQAANPAYADIVVGNTREARIAGRLVGVVRKC